MLRTRPPTMNKRLMNSNQFMTEKLKELKRKKLKRLNRLRNNVNLIKKRLSNKPSSTPSLPSKTKSRNPTPIMIRRRLN
jgi:molecular chaperone DnaK (HSP70)